jgi:hypothetical protein
MEAGNGRIKISSLASRVVMLISIRNERFCVPGAPDPEGFDSQSTLPSLRPWPPPIRHQQWPICAYFSVQPSPPIPRQHFHLLQQGKHMVREGNQCIPRLPAPNTGCSFRPS